MTLEMGCEIAGLIQDAATGMAAAATSKPGSIYLALIALTPFWIFDVFNIQTFFFGGTSLLIVVGVGLDTVQQAQQLLLLRHYDGFMKKGRVKMRGRQRYM